MTVTSENKSLVNCVKIWMEELPNLRYRRRGIEQLTFDMVITDVSTRSVLIVHKKFIKTHINISELG